MDELQPDELDVGGDLVYDTELLDLEKELLTDKQVQLGEPETSFNSTSGTPPVLEEIMEIPTPNRKLPGFVPTQNERSKRATEECLTTEMSPARFIYLSSESIVFRKPCYALPRHIGFRCANVETMGRQKRILNPMDDPETCREKYIICCLARAQDENNKYYVEICEYNFFNFSFFL